MAKVDSWNEPLYQGILARWNSLPHGLLITGPEGVGKNNLARALCNLLLCLNPNSADAHSAPCGKCRGCLLQAADSHPDFIVVAPEEEKDRLASTIKIEQLREIRERLYLYSNQGGNRAVLITPADLMTFAGANSLLKMLEEPPQNTFFLLVSARPDRLLPTIHSRCERIDVPVPQSSLVVDWVANQVGQEKADIFLSLASGAPHDAVALSADYGKSLSQFMERILQLNQRQRNPMEISNDVDVDAIPFLLICLQKWVHDLLLVKNGCRAKYFSQYQQQLAATAGQCSTHAILELQQDALRQRASINHPLNKQLGFEDMLLRYGRLMTASC